MNHPHRSRRARLIRAWNAACAAAQDADDRWHDALVAAFGQHRALLERYRHDHAHHPAALRGLQEAKLAADRVMWSAFEAMRGIRLTGGM